MGPQVVGDLVHFPSQPHQPIASSVSTSRKLLGGGGAGKWPNACTGAKGCKGKVTPAVLKQRYSIPDPPAKAAPNSSMAVAEFQGQYYNAADIAKFSAGCNTKAPVITDFGKNLGSAGVRPACHRRLLCVIRPSASPSLSCTFELHR